MRIISAVVGAVAMLASSGSAFAPPVRHSQMIVSSTSAPSSSSSSLHVSVDMMHAFPMLDSESIDAMVSSSVNVAEGIRDVAIFKGKSLSLLHPLMMFGLLAFSIQTALLGFNWRRQRTLGDEISSLKKTIPDLKGASSLADAIQVATEADDTALVAKYKAATSIEAQVQALTAERKDLAAAGPRDKHFSQGALLVFLGTFFAIEGPLNTYARAGKLFPGPHLYAGAGLVILWALAASTIPSMQKGSDSARTVHIGANIAGISLFAWQVVSGVPILLKVWEKTQWP